MFACVFAVFMYKIALRYAAGDAVAWADEISVILFIWMVFCANAFVISERRQIRFDLVYRMLPAPGRRAAAIVRLLIVGGLFLWALPGVIDYLQFLWRERTPALGLRLDFVLRHICRRDRAAVGVGHRHSPAFALAPAHLSAEAACRLDCGC